MLKSLLTKVTRITEFIAAMTLAAIFLIFLIQIFSRYAPNIAWLMPISFISERMSALQPVGWTVNLISLLWVWVIFFSCSFFVKNHDHVRFDIIFYALSSRHRHYLKLFGAVLMVGAFAYSFGPSWDAIFGSRLMELKKLQTLRIPITGDKIAIKWLFAPYILLVIAIMIRYGASFFHSVNALSRSDKPNNTDEDEAGGL